jgi:hypothetical protein
MIFVHKMMKVLMTMDPVRNRIVCNDSERIHNTRKKNEISLLLRRKTVAERSLVYKAMKTYEETPKEIRRKGIGKFRKDIFTSVVDILDLKNNN